MAEVVGVVAAAAQLTTVCLSLLDSTKRIKSAPATLRRYQVQLEDIQHISLHITQNPLLQTLEVESQTRSILALVEESSLTLFTGKGRLSQFWTLIRQERSLLESFNTLERHKTSLLLVIDSIQASALHRIHLDINTMADKKPGSSTPDFPTCPELHRYSIPSESSLNLPDDSSVPEGASIFRQQNDPAPESTYWFNTDHPGAKNTIRSIDSFTGDGSNVVNGHIVEVSPGGEDALSKMTWPNPVITMRTKSEGRGLLVNGLLIKSTGGLGSYTMPGANITAIESKLYSVYSGGKVLGGTQVTGTYTRIGPMNDSTAQAEKKK